MSHGQLFAVYTLFRCAKLLLCYSKENVRVSRRPRLSQNNAVSGNLAKPCVLTNKRSSKQWNNAGGTPLVDAQTNWVIIFIILICHKEKTGSGSLSLNTFIPGPFIWDVDDCNIIIYFMCTKVRMCAWSVFYLHTNKSGFNELSLCVSPGRNVTFCSTCPGRLCSLECRQSSSSRSEWNIQATRNRCSNFYSVPHWQ